MITQFGGGSYAKALPSPQCGVIVKKKMFTLQGLWTAGSPYDICPEQKKLLCIWPILRYCSIGTKTYTIFFSVYRERILLRLCT